MLHTYICIHMHMRSLLFILFCFHPKFSWSFVCCCFNGGTKQRNKKNRSPNCSVLQEQQQVSVGKKLPTPVTACITTPHTPSHTDTHTHTKRRLKCCSEMETGRHNTGTGYGSQNKNRENWIYTTNYALYCKCVKYTHTRIEVFSSSGIFQQFVQPVNFWVRHLLLEEEEGEGKELHFFTYFDGPDPRAVQLCMSWGNR